MKDRNPIDASEAENYCGDVLVCEESEVRSLEAYTTELEKRINDIDSMSSDQVSYLKALSELEQKYEKGECCGNCSKPLEDRKGCKLVEIDIEESSYRTYCNNWQPKDGE